MSNNAISWKVRLTMALAAVGLLASLFSLMFLHSNLNEKGPSSEMVRTVPALGPKEARPLAQELPMLNLGQLKGSVVHLNFWAQWCKPCVDELKLINAMKAEIQNYRPVLLNMDYGDAGIEQAKKMKQELAPDLLNVFGFAKVLQDLYVVQALPFHILIDKKGRTAAAFYAALDEHEKGFRGILQTLLSED